MRGFLGAFVPGAFNRFAQFVMARLMSCRVGPRCGSWRARPAPCSAAGTEPTRGSAGKRTPLKDGELQTSSVDVLLRWSAAHGGDERPELRQLFTQLCCGRRGPT